MGIERLGAVAVRDDDIVAIATVPRAITACDDDDAISGRINRRAARGCDINCAPIMQTLRDDAVR